MAVTCSFSPQILVQNPGPICKTKSSFLVLRHSGVPVKKALTHQIRSCYKTKVFEDRAEGIFCYKDENGQIICEGYDEGPRFHQRYPRTTYHPRDAEIMKLLHRQWLQIITGGELNNADKTVVALQDDFNWKWL